MIAILIPSAILLAIAGIGLGYGELHGVFSRDPEDTTITAIVKSWRYEMPWAFWSLIVAIASFIPLAIVLIWHFTE